MANGSYLSSSSSIAVSATINFSTPTLTSRIGSSTEPSTARIGWAVSGADTSLLRDEKLPRLTTLNEPPLPSGDDGMRGSSDLNDRLNDDPRAAPEVERVITAGGGLAGCSSDWPEPCADVLEPSMPEKLRRRSGDARRTRGALAAAVLSANERLRANEKRLAAEEPELPETRALMLLATPRMSSTELCRSGGSS